MSLDHLIEAHLQLPHEVARGLQARLCYRVCYDDLVSLGLIGLCDAARRFNSSCGVSFRTYARYRIRGEILDGLRMNDPISRYDRCLFRKAELHMQRLTASLGRFPDELEAAHAMAIPLRRWQKLRGHFGRLGLLGQTESTPGIDQIPDCSGNPYESVKTEERRRQIFDLIRALPVRDRLVIRLYYGRDMTLADISKQLGVGESRVCQIHRLALTNLRQQIQESGNLTGLFTSAAR